MDERRASQLSDLRRAWRAATMSVVMLFFAIPVVAQAQADLPGRVGRIAELGGQVYLAPQDDATEWSPIGINYPVTTGDSLWVSSDGRAEVDYGGGQFRLAGDTNLHVSRLDDRQLALFLAQGRLILRVRVLDGGDEVRVDTPNTQVVLTRPGLYRIEVAPDPASTRLAVREGEGSIGIGADAQQTLPGQLAIVTGSVWGSEALAFDVRGGSGVDGFDTWSANRDLRYERGRAAPYVSPQMVGSAELDEYGTWQNDPSYGPVWYPDAVASDWAPYRDGYWANVGGWGLTWVDAAPWGYAPSHYGRWVRTHGRWGWCPGVYVARPSWAPALVAWYGGSRWNASAHVGGPLYGWVPLGWSDAYRPWWKECSRHCRDRYNRGHAPDMARGEGPMHGPMHGRSNAAIPGAMTVVTGSTLVGRKPVAGNLVALPPSLGTVAPPLAAAPVVPAARSQLPTIRPGQRGAPPPASLIASMPRPPPGGATPTRSPQAPEGRAGASAPAPSVSYPRVPSGLPAAPGVPSSTASKDQPWTRRAPTATLPAASAPGGRERSAASLLPLPATSAPLRPLNPASGNAGIAAAVPPPSAAPVTRSGALPPAPAPKAPPAPAPAPAPTARPADAAARPGVVSDRVVPPPTLGPGPR